MKTFYQLLGNSLIVNIANGYVWFALIFWAYLETKSVIATSIMGGIYLVFTAASGIWFGSIVDHNKKKTAMQMSTFATLVFFILSLLFYQFTPKEAFKSVANWELWVITVLILGGAIVGNIRNIAIPTLVTILVDANKRDKANGLSGTIIGLSFAICSVISGLLLGFAGMFWVLLSAIVLTIVAIVHLAFIQVPEKAIVHTKDKPKKVDLKGTIKAVGAIPGLFAIILFSTFNNFLGGVFMALMDAYGLSLVTVQEWGLLWGFLSFGFIFGGIIIAKRGLGKNPITTLFKVNIVLWIVCIFFVIQPSIWLLAAGMLIYMTLMPFAEASEQTIIQKVVPPERQGRVFGFAQSVEQAASPLTAFMIGPIAQFIFIPYMTTGAGVDLIGDWFGVGQGRGIALVFIATGIIGLIVTLLCMRLSAYQLLSERYQKK
ncbi:MAG: MFS transporter [Candidatus Levybacteria bacterium]|nr:MFS transporter [Candidatus Levybacteria bacterium]